VCAEANVAGQSQANQNSGPSRFTDDLQPLFGDDPDPLFLEESWTLGVPAAVENLHRRRQNRAEREHQSRAFREMDSFAAVNFVPAEAADIGSYFSDRAATIASHYDSGWSRPAQAETNAPQPWTPHDWTPEDRNRQRWIPQGWMPEDVVRRLELRQEPEAASDSPDEIMTLARARELLCVDTRSTAAQVRSSYRRMVIQCHPDRYQRATESVRRQATQQMTDLNEAYRLLRTTLLENAA
jgi:hypothetical protein